MMHFDTLIVGAGSAGAILAARLSEDPARSVCLIEAGPDYPTVDELPARVRGFDLGMRVYAGAPLASHEWEYTARATSAQTAIRVPRGRLIGGSSSINGVVFLRALRADLDSWAERGNPSWAYDQCLPYFRCLEADCEFGDDDLHGHAGPIPVHRAAREDWLPPSEAFYRACTDLGHADCPDMNRPDARGVGPIPANYWQGTRYSTAIAYLIPSRPRPNLEVRSHTLATRVVLAGRRARAMEVVREGALGEIEADEIILSAGGIGSPHLLMLSGIGAADDLKSVDITPLHDLPGVGQHLRDHPYVTTTWSSSRPPIESMPAPGVPWQLQLRTTARGSSTADDGWITMILATHRDPGGIGFRTPSSLMYARSTGEVRLASADPTVAPLLDYNFLSEPSDLERLRDLARLAMEIGSHAAFAGLHSGMRQPGPEDRASKGAFDAWIQRTVGTGHHISCTCRMGPASDPLAVVDEQGRVHGLDHLRVIDASIMPDCPSVNLNATVMMMAEKLADRLAREYE
jgi:choline dehydrogenase